MVGRTILFFSIISLLAALLWYGVYYILGFVGRIAKESVKKVHNLNEQFADEVINKINDDKEDEVERTIKKLRQLGINNPSKHIFRYK